MFYILCIPLSDRAMLKLTHSFCRYTKLTCENIYLIPTHVKRYSDLSCGRKICVTLFARCAVAASFTYTCQQVRLFADIRKKLRPLSSVSAAPATVPMNNQLLPSVAYVGVGGGEFDVEDDNSMEWDGAVPSTSSHRADSKRRDKIPPDFRKWERVSQSTGGKPFRFKVVSYNVLAQYLLECHPYLYTDCDPENLSWKVRSKKLYNEIMAVNPDIICLQEVQAGHLKTFYAKFERNGYYGIFKQKTGHREDGCAIYYKKDVFDLRDHLTVEYYQPEMPILNRDNVGLIMKLVPRECPTTAVVVATTHLLYNPKRTDVRLAQLQILLAELDRFAYYQKDDGKTGYYPIVLTGDFNSLPESAVIKLLDYGKVSAIGHRDRSDWRRIAVTDNCQHLSVIVNRPRGVYTDFSMIKLQNTDLVPCGAEPPPEDEQRPSMETEVMRRSFLFNTPMLGHPLRLASVYPRTKPNHNEEATTFQDYWVTVDYIYFSCCNRLRLLERLRLPTKVECEVLGRLPNDVFGSDHLMLAAHFEIRDHSVAA